MACDRINSHPCRRRHEPQQASTSGSHRFRTWEDETFQARLVIRNCKALSSCAVVTGCSRSQAAQDAFGCPWGSGSQVLPPRRAWAR